MTKHDPEIKAAKVCHFQISIPLSGIKGAGLTAVVSAQDFYLSNGKWSLASDGYARRRATNAEITGGSPINIAMHRQVMRVHLSRGGPTDGDIDHINGDKLDNRRENLRFVSRSENNMNRHKQVGRSQYIGVSFFKPAKLWRAYITADRKRIELGYFKTEIEAAIARDRFCAANLPMAKLNLSGGHNDR